MRIAHVANTDYFCVFLLRAQLEALRAAGHDVEIVCGPGSLEALLRESGFRVHTVANSRRVDPVADLRTLRSYIALFRREDYDLVHTHNPKVNALASLAARVAGVPRVVSTVHGLYSDASQRPWVRRTWRALEALSSRLADLVLCQSTEDVRTARYGGIVPDERLRPLGNGVDLERFSPARVGRADREALRRRHGAREGERVIGFLGRLVREKGVLDLMAAVQDRRGWRLWVIGPDERGAKRDALDPRHLGTRPGVSWLGLRPDPAPWLAAVDVLVLPSHREGFPRSLIEASAMERPIVATAIRGCREAVLDRRTGLLVPPARPAAIRAALEALTGDAARARALGAAARARALACFDERAVFDRIALAYRELALPPARAARRLLVPEAVPSA